MHVSVHNIELHARKAHNAFANVPKVRIFGYVLHTLVEPLKREAPVTAQRPHPQDVHTGVVRKMVLGLVKTCEFNAAQSEKIGVQSVGSKARGREQKTHL